MSGPRLLASALAVLCLAVPARAQQAPTAAPTKPAADPLAERPVLGSVLTFDIIGNLPTAANLSSLLETTQPELTADRFAGGGLATGDAARFGAWGSSSTQTLYRVGDVNISDPGGSGAPLLSPELLYWERVSVMTGLNTADVSAPGLAVTLQPKAPTVDWTGSASVGWGGAGLNSDSSGVAPAIQRMHGFTRASALVTGTPVPDRLGAVLGAAWTGASKFEGARTAQLDSSVASAFANLVFSPTPRDDVRLVAWLQSAKSPRVDQFAALGNTAAQNQDQSLHLQASFERRPAGGDSFRVFTAFTQRARSNDGVMPAAFIMERLTDGPPTQFAETGTGTNRRWVAGLRMVPEARRLMGGARVHHLEVGADVDGASMSSSGAFSGRVGELVSGIPARVWTFAGPATESNRHSLSVSAFVSDRLALSPKTTVEAALRYESASGSADGAAQSIGWHTLLPRVSVHHDLTDTFNMSGFAGYGRSVYQLNLGVLAYGDPAAPTASAVAWNSSASPSSLPGAGGPVVMRVGPGTGGDPAFTSIGPALGRPYNDEFVVGIDSKPIDHVKVRLAGIARLEKQQLALVNTGVGLSGYSVSTVPDPGMDYASTTLTPLPIYNRLPSAFGQDKYMLTNGTDTALLAGMALTARADFPKAFLLFGATAAIFRGQPGNRGFHVTENDQGVVGEMLANPNATTFSADGRLFNDRAFTIKIAGTYKFSHDITLGAVARYQDGQPFSRMVVAPGLNQGTEAIMAFPDGGHRFTFTGTLDMRLQKRVTLDDKHFDLVLDAFNLLNLGYEVEEQIVGGANFRAITAVQPPRSVIIGARFGF